MTQFRRMDYPICYEMVTTEVIAHLSGRNSGFLSEREWQDPARDLNRLFTPVKCGFPAGEWQDAAGSTWGSLPVRDETRK